LPDLGGAIRRLAAVGQRALEELEVHAPTVAPCELRDVAERERVG